MRLNSEEQYLKLLSDVLKYGDYREGRNGGVRSLFGTQMRFNLAAGFPLLTTKKIHFKSVAVELIWFLKGESNIDYLQENGVTIWDEWADDHGELGPVYGVQWRHWRDGYHEIDQIERLMKGLKNDPFGRRHIVSAWQVAELDEMALPPCHLLMQFHVGPSHTLNCQMYQRSADIFLGVPFNIASYALLTHMVANELGMTPGVFVHTLGDYHLYENHVEQAKEQLTRDIKLLPDIALPFRKKLLDIEYEDIQLLNYHPHPAIKAPISV